MNNFSPICPDANLAVRQLVDEGDTPIHRLFAQWRSEGRELAAPTLFRYEVTNALHRLARADVMTDTKARELLKLAIDLPIRLYGDDDLHARALGIASRYSLPAAYDAHYLALAERLSAEFWTADRRLANAVRSHLPWVHLVGE